MTQVASAVVCHTVQFVPAFVVRTGMQRMQYNARQTTMYVCVFVIQRSCGQ
jgi:hypothetical protein